MRPLHAVLVVCSNCKLLNFRFYFDKEDQNLSTGIDIFETLGAKHSDRYQYIFPYYDFYKSLNSISAIENNFITYF